MNTPFDTAKPGTDEALWATALARLPAWMPQGRTLVVAAPHPDDETLGAGGLIHICAELGYEITIVLVTDGENARPELHDLARRRTGELRSALERLAPDGARVVRLRLTDGRVAASESHLVEMLLRVVSRDSTLVAPYERDGHTDHDATARACRAAAKRLGIPCVQYPIWAWHRLQPADFDALPMGRVSLSAEAMEAKQRAIACYSSQLEPRAGGAIVPRHVLSYFQRPYEVYLL